jgi:hypothetical protein
MDEPRVFLVAYPRFLQHARRSHIGWNVTARVRCAKSRERVERCCIDVVRITFVELRHRALIPEVALYFASFSVKYLNRIEICLFAICLCFGASRGRIRRQLVENCPCRRKILLRPEWMIEGHRLTPVGHREARVSGLRAFEGGRGCRILEVVE